MDRTYAIVWSENGTVASGRLEPLADRFELASRRQSLSIPFTDLESASIERSRADRLNGLPVLELARSGSLPVRIASLQGVAALLELLDYVASSGLVTGT